jgi:hypothetical protein
MVEMIWGVHPSRRIRAVGIRFFAGHARSEQAAPLPIRQVGKGSPDRTENMSNGATRIGRRWM